MPHLAKQLAALALVLALGSVLAQDVHSGHSAQSSGFSQREQEVMPFDLDVTLHTFRTSKQGGYERVTAKNPKDILNITSIREHLAKEAGRFAQGDFSDPAYLHGEDMAGLSILQEAAASGVLMVSYTELPDGAELTFITDDETVLAALHVWFDAQVSDHGNHAAADD